MTPLPYLHSESDSVRFWVPIEDISIGATIGRRTLHHRFRPGASDEDPMETYEMFQEAIHAAVRQRVAAGSREPVMLREYDLREIPAPERTCAEQGPMPS